MSILTIRIDDEFLSQLKALAWSRRAPISTVIRELLRDAYRAKVQPPAAQNPASAVPTTASAEDKYLRRQAEDILYFSAFVATLIQNSSILGTGETRTKHTQFASDSATNFLRDFDAKWSKLKT